jgi:hypothetical protein
VARELPNLVEHGVRVRAAEAGYAIARLSLIWRASHTAVYGCWRVSPS